MYKAELINAVAKKTKFSKKDAQTAVDAVFDEITDCLSKGEKVQLIGFGCFEVRHRPKRSAVNLRTQKTIVIPASKIPAFRPGKALKQAVSNQSSNTREEKSPE